MEPLPLPKHLMEVQLGEVDLLQAMYSSNDEMQMDETSRDVLESLRAWCESDVESSPRVADTAISMELDLAVDELSSEKPQHLELSISVPVVFQDDESEPAFKDDMEAPKTRIWVRQAAWMSKAEAAHLNSEISLQDTLGAIAFVKETASQLFSERHQQKKSTIMPSEVDIELSRVWFYFPSISTRAKRDDIVNYAPGYGLTGFLLAGKPGILCLEGDSKAIDNYMKFIKTESWNDIPSQHKKVSERYRESGSNMNRAFRDMQEITEDFGDTRRGARGNRNDMSVFKAWLDEHGVGNAFEKLFV